MTVEEKKEAQSKRDEQLKLDKEKYELKKKNHREYQRKKREQEKLQSHPNPLARLADSVTRERLLRELDRGEVGVRPTGIVERGEVTETYVHPDENMPEELPDGFSNGYRSGMKSIRIE